MFPYTHDTGAVTGTEPGVEFYTPPLIEINIAAFQPLLFKTNFNFVSLELDNMKWALPTKQAKHFEKMAKMTYAELTQGRESTRLLIHTNLRHWKM